MAINTTTRSAGPYTCDGTVSSFAFSFKVFSSDDVLVTASTPGASAGGSVVLVYTVTLNPDQDNFPGGYVVFTPAPSVGTTVLIGSRVTPVQTSVLQQLGGYYPKVIENALDRLTILVQQLYSKFSRVISLPDSVDTSTVSSVFPSPVATNLIGWDATASGLKNYSQAQLLSQLSTASLYGQTNAQSATGDGSNKTFTLGSSAGNVNNVQVYVGGARLRPTTDYLLGPDQKTVTLTTAPSNGAQVLFVWQTVLPVSSLAFTSEFQTAADGQTVFTLTTVTYAAGSPGALSVFVGGLRVKKGVDYSETSSSVVTFTNGLVAGDDVEFLVGSQVGAQGPTGPAGATGATGAQGPAATITVGSVTTLAAGSAATVTNVGTSGAAILNFAIPQGAAGSGSGTVTSFTFTNANGFTGTVTNGTTTPALSVGTSINGVLKGNGTAISAATAGTDYVAPGTATSFTALQTFSGSTSVFAAAFANAKELTNIVGSALGATPAVYVASGATVLVTANAANNVTPNIAFSSGTSLNTAMSVGDTVTVALQLTQGSTAYYVAGLQIDGSAVTPKWLGTSAPTAGTASGLDVYTFTITKTANATYSVIASWSPYK